MVFQQCRLGHSWISGHPHSLLYKPATAANQASSKGATGSCGSSGNSINTGAGQPSGSSSYNHNNSGSSTFLDFAGNSRYQAYTLARFSTLSVASSSASSSSFSSSSSSPSSGQAGSSGSQVPGSSSIRQEPTNNASDRHHQDRAHSNPADAQSPESSSTSTTSPLNTASSLPTSLSSASSPTDKVHDDTEDAWAVNESYSGHASSSSQPSSSDDSKGDPSRISFHQDVTASNPRDPAAIDASWRRTSDSIPSTPFSSNSVLSPSSSSSSSSSKAGGLDLSSSTLVQQMLFKERAPHADSSEGDNGRPKQDQQQISKEETSPQSSSSTADSTTASPSLASMLLNQSSGVASESRKANKVAQQQQSKAAPAQEDEDHISKLDIRVGIVRSVTAHPDAEALYIEQIDVGDKENGEAMEPRTIVSGLVRHVPKEYLEGRAVIVVGNMKPSKLRGVMSQGMLLCAMEQDDKGEVTKVGLLEPAEGSQAGDKVTFEGFTDLDTIPAAVLTPKKKWFEKSRIHFSVQDGVAYYKGSPFRTVQGLVRCKSISKGDIS
ncbi:hypothetical protein KI688_010061 [Linnemannia hyalina]|uniref:tRNA-binding domain-containing protein n=1 Tax=Linnemannia hyalina TaxID=64524 RepID=A0A9P7XXG5_9FUNG|nr:hypothetical protein KI688_010061 [Linnemannia hyalina]